MVPQMSTESLTWSPSVLGPERIEATRDLVRVSHTVLVVVIVLTLISEAVTVEVVFEYRGDVEAAAVF